jgi:hypothetical protein
MILPPQSFNRFGMQGVNVQTASPFVCGLICPTKTLIPGPGLVSHHHPDVHRMCSYKLRVEIRFTISNDIGKMYEIKRNASSSVLYCFLGLLSPVGVRLSVNDTGGCLSHLRTWASFVLPIPVLSRHSDQGHHFLAILIPRYYH